MNNEMRIAIITSVCAILGSILGSSMPFLVQHFITPGANDLADKGTLFWSVRMYDDALICFNESINIDPILKKAWYGKGRAFYGLGKYKEAISSYDVAISLSPQADDAWLERGKAYNKLGDFDNAIISYDNAILINRRLVDAWYSKGLILEKLERYNESIAALKEASEIEPNDKSIMAEIGNAYSNLNNSLQAFESYRNATYNTTPISETSLLQNSSVSPAYGNYKTRFEYQATILSMNRSTLGLQVRAPGGNQWYNWGPLMLIGGNGWTKVTWEDVGWKNISPRNNGTACYRFTINENFSQIYPGPNLNA